jgi:putative membrane-bound dehydrogenase-like protein
MLCTMSTLSRAFILCVIWLLLSSLAAAADSKPATSLPEDVVKFAGLSPQEALKAMTLPPGFSATVFAAEPDIVQPIAFTIDHRGRLWVVEGMTYPQRAPDGQGKDRILIFEDVDGDGKSDKRTIFAENLNLVSGIEVGFGGVYVGAAPYLMHIPDKDGDDKPDGPPLVLLDGWGYEDTHETLNTFTWGPDGWLYGCHGVFTHSKVGKPGAPDEQRVKINAGIWRYHPTKHTFEVFAEGTSNPWGIDFDEHGQLFSEACVIPHLFHIIQGGRYHRQAGEHFNPHTYDDIKQCADHVHWAGGGKPHAGNNRSDAAGGGHAHAGLMIYNGSAWPEEYRGKIFIGNIHGQRINMDVPEPKGSGFVAHHGADFLNFNDRWSQVVNFRAGPDGNVYFIDWYDAQQCHEREPGKHDRGNGRIYKVSYGEGKAKPVDLAKLSDEGLAKLQFSDDEWHVRTARRLLQERRAQRRIDFEAFATVGQFGQFAQLDGEELTPQNLLRRLWAEQAIGFENEQFIYRVRPPFREDNPHVWGWELRLLSQNRASDERTAATFVRFAQHSHSPIIRLYLASGTQQLPVEGKWDVLASLVSHAEDAGDHNLPLMYWYAAEPLAAVDAERAMKLAMDAKVPPILNFMTRRIASIGNEKSLALVSKSLDGVDDDARWLEMLKGLTAAFAGQRDIPTPPGWEATSAKLAKSENAEVRSLAQALSVTFGSRAALAKMRATLGDAAASLAERTAALDALVRAKDPSAAGVLQGLLADKALRGAAIRGLGAFDDGKTPELLVKSYADLSTGEKRDALNTLASRTSYAKALFQAVEAKTVPSADITADLVRQLRNLGNRDIDAYLAKAFAAQRQTPEEKLQQIAAAKTMLTSGPSGNPSRGREVFARTCQQCHVLFDAGGEVGPNITGANRADLDYLLVNILDPNALIPAEYRTTVVKTTDGRVLSGIVRKQDEHTITLAATNETIVLSRKDVARTSDQGVSMMPEGLIDVLSDAEKRDLMAYLQSPTQVPIPATPENAKTFFNGKDLTGWRGHPDLWKVENGEIVGKSEKRLENNEFLKNNLLAKDFRLTFKVKLVPDEGNSGVQFRSVPLENSPEMKGYQADIGLGWWGRIYHESGRGLLTKIEGDKVVKKNDWNTYEVLAIGHRIRTAINGTLCSDLDDPEGELEGIFAVQVHSGRPTEVRFKDCELEVDPKPEMKTVK